MMYSSRFQTWLASFHEARFVDLFDADDDLIVRTHMRGRERHKRLLRRAMAMEAAMVDVVTQGLLEEDWSGVLYVMCWGTQEDLRPLYIGKAGRWGKTVGVVSANLVRIATDRGKFARWGDGKDYHVGDLSQALFGWSAYKGAGQKYERWAEVLFADRAAPRLRARTSLLIVPWRAASPSPLTGDPVSLEVAEAHAIELAIREFEDIVLNVAGETWWAPRAATGFVPAASTKPSKPVNWVDDDASLSRAVRGLMAEKFVGLDVETTMYEQELCLVQLSGSTTTFIVDAQRVDLALLRPVLEAPAITKVIHNAAFERRILGAIGIEIDPVDDTLPWSRRLHGREVSHRLDAVVWRELSIVLDKSLQTSSWAQRPLSGGQIDYAALDAEVLLPLRSALAERDPQQPLELFE